MKTLDIHPVHGYNASMAICPICTTDIAFVFFGNTRGKTKTYFSHDGFLCDRCKELYDEGIRFVIEMKDRDHRTGNVYKINWIEAKEVFDNPDMIFAYCTREFIENNFDNLEKL